MTLTDKANLAFAASGQQAFRVAESCDFPAWPHERTQTSITPADMPATGKREPVPVTVGKVGAECITATSLEHGQPRGRSKVH